MKPSRPAPSPPPVRDEAEAWSRDRIEAFQLGALRSQLQRVGERSAHYKRVFAACGFDPAGLSSLADLQQLPFTRKADYLAGLDAEPPFGSLAAVAPGEAVRVHFSSGTTAQPVPVLWTQADLDRWADLYARYLHAQGLRRGDVLQCTYNYAWFVGGLGATLGAQKLGALVIPASSGDTERQVETLFRYGSRCLVGTPSFMAHLAETARRMGHDLRQSKVEMLCLGGEPGASIPATRERLQGLWGAQVFDCYGALECQPIAWETALQAGPTLAEDFVYAEVLHPETHEPVADGERGVLVLTHLDKQACPLVRWWTGDVVVRDRRPAADGRTHARLPGGVQGRADDMLIVRGVNLFPSAVEDIVRACPGLGSEYLLVLDGSTRDAQTGFLTGVKLRVEPDAGVGPEVAERLSLRLREALNVRFDVELVPVGSLPRAVHKARRVVHE